MPRCDHKFQNSTPHSILWPLAFDLDRHIELAYTSTVM